VCTPFEVNGGQVALDEPRVEAGVAFRPLITDDVPEEPLRSARLLHRRHHRQHRDGVADEAHGIDAAQVVKIGAHWLLWAHGAGAGMAGYRSRCWRS
jgi:hypothetical protein